MQLDLRNIFNEEGSAFVVEDDVDLSSVRMWGKHPFSQPIHVKAEAVNRAGVVTLTLSASFVLALTCDRCLAAFQRQFSPCFQHTVVRRLYGEDAGTFVVAEDGLVDGGELFSADLQLELPSKILCREDCKGLCPICGCDRNVTPCQCRQEEGDPRLAALDKFFE